MSIASETVRIMSSVHPVVGYVGSLLLAIAAGLLLLSAPLLNVLIFAFVVWAGGWYAHSLATGRRQAGR